MIEDFARRFWQERAAATSRSVRWTDDAMLAHDIVLAGGLVTDGGSLLDLGSGTGDVFLPLLDRLGHVTAVDMIPEFLARLPDDPRVEKVVSDLLAFRPAREYDAAIMFGVVTHLSEDDELRAYRLLRECAPAGGVAVKNQCGRERDVLVDGWSEALQQSYMGRYPSVDGQADRLRTVFSEVSVVPYPDELNRWSDSLHVAFVCR